MIYFVKHYDPLCLGANTPYEKLCTPYETERQDGQMVRVLCYVCNWQEIKDLETCQKETTVGARCKRKPLQHGYCAQHQEEARRTYDAQYAKSRNEWYQETRRNWKQLENWYWNNKLNTKIIKKHNLNYNLLLDAARQLTECVYFIKAGNYVKIGTTHDIENRLKQIQSGKGAITPDDACTDQMILIKTIPGSYNVEKTLHRIWAGNRVVGEWFNLDDDLLEYINKLEITGTL